MNANDVKDWTGATVKRTVHDMWYIDHKGEEHGRVNLWTWGYFDSREAAEKWLDAYRARGE